jgi:hypothetical protein
VNSVYVAGKIEQNRASITRHEIDFGQAETGKRGQQSKLIFSGGGNVMNVAKGSISKSIRPRPVLLSSADWLVI